jgi:hypothetical protein
MNLSAIASSPALAQRHFPALFLSLTNSRCRRIS